MSRGLFISFEGGDGSGKSTQYRLFAEYLSSIGYDVVLTREPGGTRISERIRGLLLDPECSEMDDMTEALLFAAARAQHVRELIRPALEEGKTVLSDRFVDSSYVYQGMVRGLNESVYVINDYALDGVAPDITFLLDISPEKGRSRNRSEGKDDRLEQQSLDFHRKVCDGFRALSEKFSDRFIVIDASGTVKEVHDEIVRRFNEWMAERDAGKQ